MRNWKCCRTCALKAEDGEIWKDRQLPFIRQWYIEIEDFKKGVDSEITGTTEQR